LVVSYVKKISTICLKKAIDYIRHDTSISYLA